MHDHFNDGKSESMAEHQERRKRCFDFETLRDGERQLFVLPAFDLRNTPDNQYGQHSCELVFAKRSGRKAVTVDFYTGWTVDNRPVLGSDGRNIGLMCTGLYTHFMDKADVYDEEWATQNNDCPYVGKKCWGELGSALYGDTILGRLINEGSYGVWDEIDKELAAKRDAD